MVLFHCRIPVKKHVVKKNNRPIHGRGTRKWLGKSKELTDAELYLIRHFAILRNQLLYGETIKGDVEITFKFYFDDFYTLQNRRRANLPDLSNLVQLPEDALQMAGVIENDAFVCSLDGSRRLPGETNELEVIIRRFEDVPGVIKSAREFEDGQYES
jgi:Holliday junction resolvase RusA-like endonuclease